MPSRSLLLLLLIAVTLVAWLVLRPGEESPEGTSLLAHPPSQPVPGAGPTPVDLPTTRRDPAAGTTELAPRPSTRHAGANPGPRATEKPELDELQVLVVDLDGVPTPAIPVDLVETLDLTLGELQVRRRAVTDDFGRATFESCAGLIQLAFPEPTEPRADFEHGRRLGVRADLPSVDKIDHDAVVWIEAMPSEGDLTVVVLPPFGWLEVSVAPPTDGDLGRPGFDSTRPYFVQVGRIGEGPAWTHETGWIPGGIPQRLGPLGLDLDLEVLLTKKGCFGPAGRASIKGPSVHGDVIEVLLPCAAERVLLGVVVMPGGRPLANTRIKLVLAAPPGTPDSPVITTAPTDSNGRWSASFPAVLHPSELRIEHLPVGDPLRHQARVDLGSLPGGDRVCDLGVIPLAPTLDHAPNRQQRLVASGKVLDSDGTPILGARVTASSTDPDEPGLEVLDQTMTNGLGAYELMSTSELLPSSVQVAVRHVQFVPMEPRRVLLGSTDVDFVLAFGASITLPSHLDPQLAFGLSLVLEGVGPAPAEHTRKTYGGTLDGLEPGQYQLSLGLAKSDWSLHTETVTLAEGQDLELEPVDLRNRLTSLHLRFLTSSGARAPRVRFAIRDDSGLGTELLVASEAGEALVIVPADRGPLVLEVGESQYPVSLEKGSMDVRLSE